MDEIEEHLDGNLCRCTGYRPIWDAARSLCDEAKDWVRGPCGTPCRVCPERDECQQECNISDIKKTCNDTEGKVVCSSSKDKVAMKNLFVGSNENWLDQPNIMFPKELVDAYSTESQNLDKPLMVVDHTAFQGAGTWFKPSSFEDLLSLLKDFGGSAGGGCKIVVGNTEVGIGESVFNLSNQCPIFSGRSTHLVPLRQKRSLSMPFIHVSSTQVNRLTNFINSLLTPRKWLSVLALL